METFNYSIDSRKRHNLSKGSRFSNYLYGAIFLAIGLHNIIKDSFSLLSLFMIVFGIGIFIFGLVGKELLMTRDYLILDSNRIKIKRSFERATKIKLNSITYIKTIQMGFEITFNGTIKRYDLSWLTVEEYQMLKTKLQIFCSQNNVSFD